MHSKVLRGLRIRHATLFDQPYSLKLELSRKLPSLHDPPPAPSKHLTRCLRNRVQASYLMAIPRNFKCEATGKPCKEKQCRRGKCALERQDPWFKPKTFNPSRVDEVTVSRQLLKKVARDFFRSRGKS